MRNASSHTGHRRATRRNDEHGGTDLLLGGRGADRLGDSGGAVRQEPPIVYLDLAIVPLYLLVLPFPTGVVLAFCRSTRRLAARFAVAMLVSGVWFALLCVVPAVRGAAAVR